MVNRVKISDFALAYIDEHRGLLSVAEYIDKLIDNERLKEIETLAGQEDMFKPHD